MKSTLLLVASLGTSLLGCSDDTPAPTPCDYSTPGTICTIAGDGKNGYSGDEGPATEARMSLPQDTLHDTDGTMFLLDWNNHRIRKVDNDGVIHHVAGRGELGGTLDDPANADFNHPTALVFDATHTKLIIAAWHNSKLRTLDLASGVISESCGDGRRAYFGDDGDALASSLDLPASLAWDPAGNLIVMDQANQVMRSIDSNNKIHRYAGKCVIDAMPPLGGGPCATGVDPVACPNNSGKFTCGNMATCSAPCTPGYAGDDGLAMSMRTAQPFGQSADPAGRIVFDAAGNLYFADTANALIRKITTDGMVHRFAGTAPMAGVAQSGYAGDGGPALDAKLNNPVDLAFGPDGTLYFTDVYNHCVRGIAPSGTIKTVAGKCGVAGYEGDGGPATEALLKRSYGLEVFDGVLYIADTGNQVIRAVRL
ncbi:MAG: hypothetical protein NT062_30415 [Proteobacteria bacterium]|nr:hypothetical protein [Pseudomonadota bacterium]